MYIFKVRVFNVRELSSKKKEETFINKCFKLGFSVDEIKKYKMLFGYSSRVEMHFLKYFQNTEEDEAKKYAISWLDRGFRVQLSSETKGKIRLNENKNTKCN